ncbi:MAG TPA: hypothetical protein VJ728_13855 [Candidatus Binataceae bacterium]|nr:hypothetical protein [Candidatus Binataceae bacterium]
MSLYNGSGTLIAANDNWRDTQASEILATGLEPTDNSESAIVATLPPATYAVALSGKNNSSGVGLNEIYDVDSESSKLAAIGTRDNALTGENVVISGFTLSGTQSQSLLFRALGPSLTSFGLAGVLADPVLELHDPDGNLLVSDDNWKDVQQSEIEATGLAPKNDAESAILVTLSPGSYTAIASGHGSTGIVFVEGYAIPFSGNAMNPVLVPDATPSPTPSPTATPIPTATPETATAVVSSRSIAMDAFSGTLPNGTHVTNYVTTSDGVPGVSLFSDIYGNPYANEEVRPLQFPVGAYQADYVTFDDFGIIDYGTFTINLPTADSDSNGLPDFEQKGFAGNFSFSGSSVSDVYGTVATLAGSGQRSANSTGGSYTVTVSNPGNPSTYYSGAYYLLNASGTINYSRGTVNTATFNLVEAFQTGGSRTLTGSTTFTVVSATQITFAASQVTSNDGFTYTVQPFTLTRQGSKYMGSMMLTDGDPLTSWGDYLSWVVEVTDANDTDGDGIPDLSDVPVGPITGEPLNISTRLNVLTADNVLIGGFVITGSGPKKLLILGVGPSLSAYGIANPLNDPTLELHSGNSIIASNDNWKDTQQNDIEATTLQPSNDAESAILITLNPGAYTAILAGKSGGVGVGLVEVYDLDPEGESQLGNISTRGFVSTGDNVMIGGFIIGGSANGPGRLILRGIGPSLSAFGISGALQDPTLEVHDANGATIGTNDNWQDSQSSQIAAEGLAPTDPRESAILMVLPSGAYTVILRGANNSTGVGLVEAYNVP